MADLATWIPVIAALGGVSGIAAVVRLWSERSSHNKDLAVALNATARDWIDYIDHKFDEVSTELEKSKREQLQQDRVRHEAWRAHHEWDIKIKRQLERATGEPVDDPPPLDPV